MPIHSFTQNAAYYTSPKQQLIFMQKQLRLPKRTVSLAISELTEEITSQTQIQQIVLPDISYQLIPGYLQTTTIDIDRILLWLLPYSNSLLIDIALPYHDLTNSQPIKLLARYILFNRKIVGIRTCCCKQWPTEKVEMISPSISIQKYYRQNKIPFLHNEIIVGSFYLQLWNCRIGLLFQSQLLANPTLLSFYHRYKCDILSIVSNTQKQINKHDQTFKINPKQKQLLLKLKTIARQQMVTLLFAGAKIVPSLHTIYWQKSFIMQGTQYQTQTKTLIGQPNSIQLLAKLNLTLQHKWNQQQPEQESEQTMNQDAFLEKLNINAGLKENEKIQQLQTHHPANKKILSDFVGLKEIILYNLYYLFSTVNQYSPFVIPYPFSENIKELFNHLLLLQTHSCLSINDLVKLYSTKPNPPSHKNQVKIYQNFKTMLSENKNSFPSLIYLYSDDTEELKNIKHLSESAPSICNCISLIPFSNPQPIKHEPTNMQLLQTKKLEKACVHVLNQRMQNLDEILGYFWDCHFNRKEIETCFTDILPKKVRKFFKLTPHYLFLLHSSPSSILTEIAEAQIRLKYRTKSKIIVEDWDKIETLEDIPKRLSDKIEAARAFKNKLKQYPKCHLCKLGLKKDLLYTCSNCNNALCFECLDILTHHSIFELNKYKCLICLGKCNCSDCKHTNNIGLSPTKIAQPPGEHSEHPIFNKTNFQCSRCEILGEDYDFIRIFCAQCKALKCYNCARIAKDFDSSQLIQWICEDCKNFNKQITSKIASRSPREEMSLIEEIVEKYNKQQQNQVQNKLSLKINERQDNNQEEGNNLGKRSKEQKKKKQKRKISPQRNSSLQPSSSSPSPSHSISRSPAACKPAELKKNNEKSPRSNAFFNKKNKTLWNRDNSKFKLSKKQQKKRKNTQKQKGKDPLKQETKKSFTKAPNSSSEKNQQQPYKSINSERSALIFQLQEHSNSEQFSY